MCIFHYCTYATCECELYDDHPKYCQEQLYPYPHYHHDRPDRPRWVKILLVREPDEHRLLDEYHNETHYTTNPDDRRKRVGCENSKFEEKGRFSSRDCPYHGSGELKKEWDRINVNGSKGVEKLEQRREQKRNDHYAAEKRRMELAARGEVEGNSCCIVQ